MRANLSRSYPPTAGRPAMLARLRRRCRRCGRYVWAPAPDGCCDRCSDYRPLGRWPDPQLRQLDHGQALDVARQLGDTMTATTAELRTTAAARVPVLPAILAAPRRRRWGQ